MSEDGFNRKKAAGRLARSAIDRHPRNSMTFEKRDDHKLLGAVLNTANASRKSAPDAPP
jgi:hypothetical protein